MVFRSTPPSRLSCCLRFWMWNASLIFSLPLPACTIYCLHALPIDFMWHRLFMDMLGNGWLGALSKSKRIATFLLSYTKHTQSFAYIFTRARFAFHRVHSAGDRICWKSVLLHIKRAKRVLCEKCAPNGSSIVRAVRRAFWLRPSTAGMLTVIGRGSFVVCFCRSSAQLVVCRLIWLLTTLLMNFLG